MNIIEKRKMAEGVLYNFHLSRNATADHVDVLITIKDLLRSAGLVLIANDYGQIEMLDIDSRAERARALFI
jgi:hypothetical protein